MKTLAIVFLVLGIIIPAQSRILDNWTYQELFDKSDLVVIAKPTSTQETTEQSILPNISPDTHVIGLATEFHINVVMKGDQKLKTLTLHHYKLAPLPPNESFGSGPNLVSFDSKSHDHFLLFLRREADGRYAPVSGQVDPRIFSVLKLDGAMPLMDMSVNENPPPVFKFE